MSVEECPFKIGDKVVAARAGGDTIAQCINSVNNDSNIQIGDILTVSEIQIDDDSVCGNCKTGVSGQNYFVNFEGIGMQHCSVQFDPTKKRGRKKQIIKGHNTSLRLPSN